jgi:RNA polymerase sigma-70 factor, ECF subfamily
MFEHPDEDAADARRVLGGDISAFEGIVRRWQGRLVNLAWRFCRDRSMAEDMAQEAFVKAFRALDTYRGEAVFSEGTLKARIHRGKAFLKRRLIAAGVLGPLRTSTER